MGSDFNELFQKKEELVKQYPGLKKNFDDFLKGQAEYNKVREDVRRIEDYLLYGAQFQTEG